MVIVRVVLVFVLGVVCSACDGIREAPTAPLAIRLVDRFDATAVIDAVAPAALPSRTEWRFDGAPPVPAPAAFAATRGWEAGPGINGLTIQNGTLTGRTSTPVAMVRIERTGDLSVADQLHSIEVRIRVSAGANLSLETSPDEKPAFEQIVGQMAGLGNELTTPITPGDEMRTYVITKARPLPASQIRHVFIRPSDAPGATFAIESVRLIFRREHLAAIPSGVGWQGMGEVYRESIVTRAPEQARFAVSVPAEAWLDVGLGTVDEGAVTFKVGVARSGHGGPAASLLEHTVTTPYRWESRRVDLAAFSGQDVTLTLSVAAAETGAIGLWGAPVVRRRSLAPPVAEGVTSAFERVPQGVVVIWADTLRKDHLDAYGYGRETAPALRQFAREGVLFQHNTSQATWTKVSTPSMATSLYPSTHGVVDFNDRLPAAATTLAEVYRAAGYATVGYASNLFTGQFTNLHQGFEEQHEDGSLPNQGSSKTAREYVDRFTTWLEAHREIPFFAFLHLYDPHDPFEPGRPYDSLWADPAKRDEHYRNLDAVRKVISDPLMRLFGMPTREELVNASVDPDGYVAHDVGWYDGSIRGLDTEIARLMERLRTLGLDERTLVVFVADHGEEFLDHGRTFHGQTVYGELTQVPLMMRWPGGLPANRVVEDVVQTIDVMPTLLSISGLPTPAEAQGQSMVPLLDPNAGNGGTSSAWQPRPAISEKALTDPNKGAAPPPHDTEAFAIVDGGWKLVHHTTRPRGGPEFELFDFAKDPLNLANVADAHPEIVQRLAKALAGWRHMATTARLKPDAEATKGLTQEQLQRLRSLGYIR
jgi:arylsulfatase A-like enzyme